MQRSKGLLVGHSPRQSEYKWTEDGAAPFLFKSYHMGNIQLWCLQDVREGHRLAQFVEVRGSGKLSEGKKHNRNLLVRSNKWGVKQ